MLGATTRELIALHEGKDYILSREARLPFIVQKLLGYGASASVEQVELEGSRVFALKKIRSPCIRLKALTEQRFDEEVKIIRRLHGHPHIIEAYATYRDNYKREFGIFLRPAANQGNLAEFMGDYIDLQEYGSASDSRLRQMSQTIDTAFGCLAGGLSWIHQQSVRHKDVKPHNIVIHSGSVYITDFGSSRDCLRLGDSITEGPPDFLTRRYAAPEVLSHDRRDYAADVYSLGCILFELLCVRGQVSIEDIQSGYSDALHEVQLKLATAEMPLELAFLPPLISRMLEEEPRNRSTAGEVFQSLHTNRGFCCSECRSPDVTHSAWVWSTGHQHYFCHQFGADGFTLDTFWTLNGQRRYNQSQFLQTFGEAFPLHPIDDGQCIKVKSKQTKRTRSHRMRLSVFSVLSREARSGGKKWPAWTSGRLVNDMMSPFIGLLPYLSISSLQTKIRLALEDCDQDVHVDPEMAKFLSRVALMGAIKTIDRSQHSLNDAFNFLFDTSCQYRAVRTHRIDVIVELHEGVQSALFAELERWLAPRGPISVSSVVAYVSPY